MAVLFTAYTVLMTVSSLTPNLQTTSLSSKIKSGTKNLGYLLFALLLSTTSCDKQEELIQDDVVKEAQWDILALMTYSHDGKEITDTLINEVSNEIGNRISGIPLSNGENNNIGTTVFFPDGLLDFVFYDDILRGNQDSLNRASGYVSSGMYKGETFIIKNLRVQPGDSVIVSTEESSLGVCHGPQSVGKVDLTCKRRTVVQ